MAVISLFVEPLPIDNDGAEPPIAVRFRKFACDPGYQGRGIGTKLLAHAVLFANSELKGDVLWCDARMATLDWYRKRGLIPFGSIFYKGSVEYVRIKMDIRTAGRRTVLDETLRCGV